MTGEVRIAENVRVEEVDGEFEVTLHNGKRMKANEITLTVKDGRAYVLRPHRSRIADSTRDLTL